MDQSAKKDERPPEEIPEPPEGADQEIWNSIPPEVHQEASQVARVLLGVRPESDRRSS